MSHDQLINMLNELLACEQASVPIRLMESTVFVSQLAVSNVQTITQMAAQSREHAAWLTRLVLKLGGAPGLRMGDIHSADFNFQELRFALPRLMDQEEVLIHKYLVAIGRVTSEPIVSELLSTIVAQHQNHLVQLKKIDNNQSQAAGTEHSVLK